MKNPYASPHTLSSEEETVEFSPERQRYAQLGEVVVAWERLRIWYNVALAGTTLLAVSMVGPRMLLDPRVLGSIVVAAIAANACFSAGPITEGYITWWFGSVRWLRNIVFLLGTLGSVALTFAVILLLEIFPLLPSQN